MPLLLASSVLIWLNYTNERNYLEERTLLGVANVGKIVLASLRPAMIGANQSQMNEMVNRIGSSGRILQVVIMDPEGVVKYSSDQVNGTVGQKTDPGCKECHEKSADQRPEAIFLNEQHNIIRIVVPILNEPACYGCHDPKETQIGLLLVDNGTADMQKYLQSELLKNTLISLFGICVLMVGVYISSHWLVVRRLEQMQKPLASFAEGNFSVRIGERDWVSDEISEFSRAFDDLADQLQKHQDELSELNRAKAEAIAEERERIARELHDGVAQLLGYVNNKTSAIRLLLEKNQIQAAQTNLSQLESATQQVFLDLREAILGLRMSSRIDEGFDNLIIEYSNQFAYLSDLLISVEIDPIEFDWQFDGGFQLELFRIIQEALHNIRKHAEATQVVIKLSVEMERDLHLQILDDGVGFNPGEIVGESGYHFGLESMKQRTNLIGGMIVIDSNIGQGTKFVCRFLS